MALGGVLPQSSFTFPNNCGKMQPTSSVFGKFFFWATRVKASNLTPPAGCGLIAVAGPKFVAGEANEGKVEEICPFWCC